MKFFLFIFILLFIVNKNFVESSIEASRQNDQKDFFPWNAYPVAENKSLLKVFNKVKEKEKIAIDLGACEGAASIWLSRNFHHVVAVEADTRRVESLSLNLKASNCTNVTICSQPIYSKRDNVIFGPLDQNLSESISPIKPISDSSESTKKTITFKQLVYDYIYQDTNLSHYDISFINCDIAGAEEYILEDVLHFAYHNQCKLYVSFHIDSWKTKKVDDFKNLFRFFTTNCPKKNICKFLLKRPNASILFEPKKVLTTFVKPNLPAIIIGYNQLTYIKQMVQQLEKYTSDITIIDNKSDFQPLLDYYENEFKYTLLKQKENYGHLVFHRDEIKKLTGDLYVLTDPDLKFNENLPKNFLEDFINISHHFRANKVGFALLIEAEDLRTDVTYLNLSIKEWESQFWTKKLVYPFAPNIELFRAPIDTTFSLVNRKFERSNTKNIRVAGKYTCKHIPWHLSFQDGFLEGEYESYLKTNKSTNWFK